MPQLIPDPWFFIFMTSWLILLFLAPKKILNHSKLNEFNPKTTNTAKYLWTWPWQ
uniref:ATP synthase complex subunit 8 n=1 Tax=Tomopterna cryptotis TaxID=143410 RepID=S4V094_9NEOB|nr:ATP synthase F0 subunit 8 [Tomopterna cryptotis]